MDQVSIGQVVEDNALSYGRYVNRHRAIPSIDGLKDVHRRVLLTTRQMAREFKKVSTISGNVIANWHPHGSASVDPVVSELVRWALLEGQGNHGAYLMTFLQEGAPRYVEAKYKSSIEDQLFRLMEYAPHFDNELGHREPQYLITPIPIMLLYGTIGIGYGCDTRIPAFSYASLLQAYKKNNASLLRPTYGYEIIHGKSEIEQLWETGEGWLCYRFNLDWTWSKPDECKVVIITGRGESFVPAIHRLNKYLEQGHIFIRDESTTNIRLVIGRNKYVKAISDEELFELCKDISTYRKRYRIRVNVFDTVQTIGIKSWLNITLELFRSNFTKWKKDQIAKLNRQIEIYLLIPSVGQLLIKGMSTEDIAKKLRKDITIIKEIEGKPMRMLRKADFSVEIDKFRKQLDSTAKSDANSIIESFAK